MPAVSQRSRRGDLERDFPQKAQASKNGCDVYPSHAFAAQLAQDFPKRFPNLERFACTINWHAIIPFGSLPAAFRFSVAKPPAHPRPGAASCCSRFARISFIAAMPMRRLLQVPLGTSWELLIGVWLGD